MTDKQPNWAEAPADATRAMIDAAGTVVFQRGEQPGTLESYVAGTWFCSDEKWRGVHLRPAAQPEAPTWDGKGLPPVGVRCETRRVNTQYTEVEILHYGSERVFVRLLCNDTEALLLIADREFRPIVTAEQRAAKERDETVAAMLTDMALDSEVSMRDADAARALYAAGWRKIEGEWPWSATTR